MIKDIKIIRPKEKKELSNIDLINKMIADSIEQSEQLEEIIADAPDILDGYENIREILRMEKRGIDHKKAVNYCAFMACPPSHSKEYRSQCDSKCEECWNKYYDEYAKIINKD